LLNLLPSNANGVLQIDFSETKIDIENYHVSLVGSSDVSKATQIMMNSFKEFFKKDLANMLAWRLAKSVQESLNQIILDKGQNIPIPPVQVKINTTLIGAPIFKNGLLAVPLDGTFSSYNQAAPDVEFASLPIFIGDL
jgi:hypothetical protein